MASLFILNKQEISNNKCAACLFCLFSEREDQGCMFLRHALNFGPHGATFHTDSYSGPWEPKISQNCFFGLYSIIVENIDRYRWSRLGDSNLFIYVVPIVLITLECRNTCINWEVTAFKTYAYIKKQKTNSVAFSPRANYTD
jgi:hypothetical protein